VANEVPPRTASNLGTPHGANSDRSNGVIVKHRQWRALLLVVLAVTAVLAPAAQAARPRSCGPRTLVLAAMPLELDPLLRAADIDRSRTVTIDGRTFYAGTLGSKDVVLAMTGIGMVNAAETAQLAIDRTRCPFSSAMFSGVAGSRFNIGDVAVPSSWTQDEGKTWIKADEAMLAAAESVAAARSVALSRTTPVGDAACLCPGVEDPATPVTMPHETIMRVGGQGTTSDMFSGKAVPCLPGGGDVAGCAPCLPGATADEAAAFAAHAPSLADPTFLVGFLQPPAETTDTYAAQDMETAAVAAVATENHVPFLGVRAVSDGQGDPLHLPGFPWQFLMYRRLAGNNAALVAEAILQALPA
jgi:nucleoside phosphorylase